MVGGRLTADLPRAVRAWIEARTGDAVFVVPDFRIFSGTSAVDLYPSQHEHPRDVPLYEVEPAAWLLVLVEEEGGQRP